MTPKTQQALLDLLRVQDLAQIRPSQVQAWQAAARDLLAEADLLADRPAAAPTSPAKKESRS